MDISKLLEKAKEAVDRRNYDYAVELYKQALIMSPDDAQARRDLRAVEHRVAKERGIGFMAKAKVMANSTKASTLLATKKYDAAMQAAEDALMYDPGNVGALMTLGKAAASAGYKKTAVSTYEDLRTAKAGGKQKTMAEVLRNLAFAYEADGMFSEALDIWMELKKVKPDDRDAGVKVRDLSASIMTKKVQDNSQGAGKGSIARSLARDQNQLARSDREGQEIRSADDLAAAIADVEADIQERPDDPRLYVKLGDLHKRGNNYDEAKKAYQGAKEKDPTNHQWQFRLDDLDIWRSTNELRALAPKVKAGQIKRDDFDKRRLAVLDMRLKSFVERERHYSTDARIRFELANIYFEMATLKKDKDLYDEAIKRFQQTFKDPKYRYESGLKWGQGFAAKGQFELALKRFDETLSGLELKDDRWKSLNYSKGLTLAQSGKEKEALETFLQIYEVDVAFKDVSKRIEDLQQKVKA